MVFAECYDCNLVHGYNITMSIDATMIPQSTLVALFIMMMTILSIGT